MIIDGHCHFGVGDGLTGPWNTKASLENYLRRASRAGIKWTVLLPVFHSNYAQMNAQLAKMKVRAPNRFICFAGVHAVRDVGHIYDMVSKAFREWGFQGIKVHRGDAQATREICETAQKLKLPILYDVMGEISLAEILVTEYPSVNFIIPHLGSFADDWRAHTQTIDLLCRFPNVYSDTSGVRRFDFLIQAIKRAGPQKIIFGSDGPWLHPGLELYKIKLLGLSKREEELVLSKNFLGLINGGY